MAKKTIAAAVRVCEIIDVECSQNCGTEPCKKEREAQAAASRPKLPGIAEFIENQRRDESLRDASLLDSRKNDSLTKEIIGKAWRECGALSNSPPDWALIFAHNIANSLLARSDT